MSYLNPPYPNNFQELCASMPLFYLEVFEMRAILRAQGRLLDGVCAGMEKLVDVNFILAADEAVVRMWEKALEITYTNALSLEMRKHVIIGYIIGLGHIGEPEICEIIALYTDLTVEIAFDRGDISITLDGLGPVPAYSNLLETLYKRIPAHLTLRLSVNLRSPDPAAICIGGSMGAQSSFGVPLQSDQYDFQDTIHTGSTFSSRTIFPVPADDSAGQVSTALYSGGTFSARADIPVPENAALLPSTTILRTGGVCTILSNQERRM